MQEDFVFQSSHLIIMRPTAQGVMFSTGVRGRLAHLGYCGIAAGCGCCTAAHASHTLAESSPNSAEGKKDSTQVRTMPGLI